VFTISEGSEIGTLVGLVSAGDSEDDLVFYSITNQTDAVGKLIVHGRYSITVDVMNCTGFYMGLRPKSLCKDFQPLLSFPRLCLELLRG